MADPGSDEETAQQFGTLAVLTADRTLATAIQRVADLFAAHAPSVPSDEVQALCR